MRLRVENLGAIREAEVDFSTPLTVLTGPNNTGKTWFSWAAYWIVRYGDFSRLEFLNSSYEQPSRRSFLDIAEEICSQPESIIDRSRLDERAKAWVKARSNDALKELPAAFGLDSSERFSHTSLSVQFADRDFSEVHNNFSCGSLDLQVEGTIEKDGPLVARSKPKDPKPLDPAFEAYFKKHPVRTAQDGVAGSIARIFDFSLFRQSEIFTAERASISVFAPELVAKRSGLIDNFLARPASGANIVQAARLYPVPIRDGLQEAVLASMHSQITSPFADIADDLEASLLGGRVKIGSTGEFEYHSEFLEGRHLRMQNASSTVKSLAPIVFYLRHQAHPTHRVIVDEPELNLHPDNQRVIARFIARAVNRGLRVTVSTHSDYFLRELSNLVRLGAAGERADGVVKKLNYDPSWLLRPDQVGVYLFSDGTARQMPVDENGFSAESIENEIRRLDRETQEILFALEES